MYEQQIGKNKCFFLILHKKIEFEVFKLIQFWSALLDKFTFIFLPL